MLQHNSLRIYQEVMLKHNLRLVSASHLALRSFAFLDDKSQLGEHVLPKNEELGILARAVLH